jgi:hypothetical protein
MRSPVPDWPVEEFFHFKHELVPNIHFILPLECHAGFSTMIKLDFSRLVTKHEFVKLNKVSRQ